MRDETEKLRVREVIIVEGKYDRIRLSSLIDGVILETGGFQIFRDKEKLALIRRMAAQNGIVILTDSDGAGFLIRGKLCSCIPPEQIKNAYIPDILGKERRKRAPSREGKLGVEGMETRILREALARAGVSAETAPPRDPLTKTDLYELGLSGGPDSREKRARLLRQLDLPEHLSANGLLQVLRGLYSREEFLGLWEEGLKHDRS